MSGSAAEPTGTGVYQGAARLRTDFRGSYDDSPQKEQKKRAIASSPTLVQRVFSDGTSPSVGGPPARPVGSRTRSCAPRLHHPPRCAHHTAPTARGVGRVARCSPCTSGQLSLEWARACSCCTRVSSYLTAGVRPYNANLLPPKPRPKHSPAQTAVATSRRSTAPGARARAPRPGSDSARRRVRARATRRRRVAGDPCEARFPMRPMPP